MLLCTFYLYLPIYLKSSIYLALKFFGLMGWNLFFSNFLIIFLYFLSEFTRILFCFPSVSLYFFWICNSCTKHDHIMETVVIWLISYDYIFVRICKYIIKKKNFEYMYLFHILHILVFMVFAIFIQMSLLLRCNGKEIVIPIWLMLNKQLHYGSIRIKSRNSAKKATRERQTLTFI